MKIRVLFLIKAAKSEFHLKIAIAKENWFSGGKKFEIIKVVIASYSVFA